MKLFDTHCHIDFDDFDHDREKVLESAAKNGINRILVPGVSQARWQQTIKVCEQYQACELALGLHPIFIDQHQPQHLVELDQLISRHKPIAVGEIGLDFYHKDTNKNKQRLFFEKQLVIAKQHSLPVIIHNRKAHDECIAMLKEHQVKSGIIHAFNGSIQQAHHYIEQGFALGFGGMLTYARSTKLRNLAQQIPLSAIVLETDAPDMTVSQFKGQRNSPEYIPYILNALAEIKSHTSKEIAQITTQNAEKILLANNAT